MHLVDQHGLYWDVQVAIGDDGQPLLIVKEENGELCHRLRLEEQDLLDLSDDLTDAFNDEPIGSSRGAR